MLFAELKQHINRKGQSIQLLGHQKRKRVEPFEISVHYNMREGVTQGAELCDECEIRSTLLLSQKPNG